MHPMNTLNVSKNWGSALQLEVHRICYCCQGDEDLILVHDALEYGDCYLSLAVSCSCR